MISEEEVYNGTKKLLIKNDFTIFAGQPPRGVDHLPVVEIKSGLNSEKGSKDVFKPDLLAFNKDIILIIECKPSFCTSDINKLYNILDSQLRLKSFYDELQGRNLLNKIKYNLDFTDFCNMIYGCIAYSSNSINNETLAIEHIFQIIVSNWKGEGLLIPPKNKRA